MANLSPYAFIELFVVLAFLGAWGILELVGKRLDARRVREAQEAQDGVAEVGSAASVERPNEMESGGAKH